MKSHRFLLLWAALGFWSLCFARQSRPNILFLVTDQQRFDTIRRVQDELSQYDNVTKIRTPHLDALSREGAYFRAAYCQCPVCGPARTSLRTGCTIERTGIQHNLLTLQYKDFEPFKDRVEALKGLDHVLVEKYGYRSEYYGKWHLPDTIYSSFYTRDEHNESTTIIDYNDYDYGKEEFFFRDTNVIVRTRAYLRHFEKLGNISHQLQDGQQIDTLSRYPYTPIHLDARHGFPTGTPLKSEDGFKLFEITQPNVCGRYALSEDYTPSAFTGDTSLKALDRLLEEDTDKPFLLTVSFHNPHPPMVPASKYLDYYWKHRDSLFVSPSLHDSLENSAYDKPISRSLPKYADPQNIQEWTAVYYALIEEIDHHVGALTSRLGEAAANTLIIFTSDHGEMLGAHGHREKNMFYEESVRVPLLISFPGTISPNTVVEDSVSHLDLYSTILDYVGVEASEDTSDGKSLRSFIEQRKSEETNVVVAEWDFRIPYENNPLKLDRTLDDAPAFMILKGVHKLMVFKDSKTEKLDMMFDLEADPYEMNNLLGTKGMTADYNTLSKAEHLRCELLDWMNRMDGNVGYYSDPAANYGEGNGDIQEVTRRQKWRALGFWVDPPNLDFGSATGNDNAFVGSEYLYLGKRTPGAHVLVHSVSILGSDARHFSVDKNEVLIEPFQCQRIKVTFTSLESTGGSFAASIILKRHGTLDISIPISVTLSRDIKHLRNHSDKRYQYQIGLSLVLLFCVLNLTVLGFFYAKKKKRNFQDMPQVSEATGLDDRKPILVVERL